MAGLDGRVHAQLGGELEVHPLVGALEGSPIMPLDGGVGGMCEHRRAHAEHVYVPGGGGERRAQGGGADDERGHRGGEGEQGRERDARAEALGVDVVGGAQGAVREAGRLEAEQQHEPQQHDLRGARRAGRRSQAEGRGARGLQAGCRACK